MKMTLDLSGRLIRAAKRRAERDGVTLAGLIELALRHYLQLTSVPDRNFRARLLTKGGQLASGIDLDDRVSLYERMHGPSRLRTSGSPL